ncbi:beta-L-arabinofuranosidase domain-containing protein [Terriglobus sp.]|uniref:beta-L-arabinofuranosidase domain-containing protein n=1 Tax=Terriglobus sp. TaxID=1889013 RepID=UPI003B00BC6C
MGTQLALQPGSAYGSKEKHAPGKVTPSGAGLHASAGSGVKNRAPLAQNAFTLLPLGSVRPTGWLRRQLEVQATGLGGHLDETWADVGSNSGWLGGTGESWERGPYFLDGLIPLAYLLDDDRLKAKAQKYIDWTLTHQAADGMIGPASNNDWWPRMVMLKALAQYEEATGDPRVIPVLSRYFAHQLSALPGRPLRDWGKFRWQDNALVVIWLYNRTGDPKLLDLARLLHQQGFDWQADFADFKYTYPVTPEKIKLSENNGLNDIALATHGVNNGQALKAAPVWSVISGNAADRRGFAEMQAALDKYHGLPNGMFSCDEHFAGPSPSQGSELCTVVETMFSLEQSLAILGDASIGDRLERLAFNALPGTFTDDMWAHQYNQQPNQVEVSLHRKPWTTDGPESNLYGLEPNFGCCTANFHQGWPKFVASLWMASQDGGIVATAYSPCEVHTSIGDTAVHISEETDYPFRGTVRLTITPSAPVRFPLHVRVPAWAGGTVLTINGETQSSPAVGAFARLDRTWKPGDTVEMKFPMKPKVVTGFHQSVSIERGPLVFSYPIAESWVKLRTRGMTADWQVFPASEWNYALAVDTGAPDGILDEEHPIGGSPFALSGTPITIQVAACKLPSWRAEDGVANVLPESPVTSDEKIETIRLVPYAAAKLRITSFPQLRKDEKNAA